LTGGYRHDRIKGERRDEQRETRAKHWSDSIYGVFSGDRVAGKEMDEETGLYYYGARYLDLKYSRWLSGDPALGDYIPKAPIDDEAKKHNENLPGMGGVFNIVNLHLYYYAGIESIASFKPIIR